MLWHHMIEKHSASLFIAPKKVNNATQPFPQIQYNKHPMTIIYPVAVVDSTSTI
jgi:hypothetical protein